MHGTYQQVELVLLISTRAFGPLARHPQTCSSQAGASLARAVHDAPRSRNNLQTR